MLVMFEHKAIDFKRLSDIIDLKTGTLTPMIQKLEEIGYIKKEKNTNDFRKVDVILTKKGKELQKQIIEVPVNMAKDLQITEEMYLGLTKELDDLSLILKNASIKREEKK
jgi:DNA-binding MarR family transcriptional regulator